MVQCFFMIKPSENIYFHKRAHLFDSTTLHQELSAKLVRPFQRLLLVLSLIATHSDENVFTLPSFFHLQSTRNKHLTAHFFCAKPLCKNNIDTLISEMKKIQII